MVHPDIVYEEADVPQYELPELLICAHGNSLRALVKYLGDISDEEIVQLYFLNATSTQSR